MTWAHYWKQQGHVPKVLVTHAGAKLDCAALAPWLRRSGEHAIEGSSGLVIQLENIRVDEEGALVRGGTVTLPNGHTIPVLFGARYDRQYRHRKHWFGLCGVCGRRITSMYLELAEVPVCWICGRVRYITESTAPDQRPLILAIKNAFPGEDREEIKLNWRLRRAAALRAAWKAKKESVTGP